MIYYAVCRAAARFFAYRISQLPLANLIFFQGLKIHAGDLLSENPEYIIPIMERIAAQGNL